MEVEMRVRAMISDFDGPINDSFREGLRRIHVLCGLNGIDFSREKRRGVILHWGKPGAKMLELALRIPEADALRIYKQWEIYDLIHPVPLVPGAAQVLNENKLKDIKNTLLTSRNSDNVVPILKKQGIYDFFSVVQTRQDWSVGKPNPQVFDYTLPILRDEFGISKEECVFVGDTPDDVRAGLAAGIETIVVLTGPYWLEHMAKFPIRLENILPSIDYFPEWLEKYSE